MTTLTLDLNITELETEASDILAYTRSKAQHAPAQWHHGKIELRRANGETWTVLLDTEINEDLEIIYYFDDGMEQYATARLDRAIRTLVTVLKWEMGMQ